MYGWGLMSAVVGVQLNVAVACCVKLFESVAVGILLELMNGP